MQPMYQPEIPIVEALSQTYEAWVETPGALELWQELSLKWDTGKSSSSGGASLMQGDLEIEPVDQIDLLLRSLLCYLVDEPGE